MNVKYESNNKVSKNPFEIELVKENGEMYEYFSLSDDVKERITLSDLVDSQVEFIENDNDGKFSSGYFARNASSGDFAKNASSGYYAQNASSGDFAKNETTGKNSVTFDCGYKSTIKAVNGTWISLCEYEKTNEDKYIPIFALAGQIGNSNYIDCNGKVLSEKETYLLYKKQFTPIIDLDGVMYKKNNSRIKTDLEIIKCEDMDSGEQVFCVAYDSLSAHGYTLREAMEDLKFKQTESMEKSEIVAEIKKTGVVTRAQYRGITRACIPGMDSFASEHGYQNVEEVSLNELISKLDDKYWGAKEFKNLFKD